MVSFSQYITEIQDHTHQHFSFPNFKETGLFVVSLDHVGGIWWDTNTYQKSYFYESMKLWKYLSTCLMNQLLTSTKKIAVQMQLWLEKWLSKNNNIFSQQFYYLNEFAIGWVLQQSYHLFTALYSLVRQHQHRRERQGAVTIITSHFNKEVATIPQYVFELGNMKVRRILLSVTIFSATSHRNT